MSTKRRARAAASGAKASPRAKWSHDLEVRPGETRLAAFLAAAELWLQDVRDLSGDRVSMGTIHKYRFQYAGKKLPECLIIAQALRPKISAFVGEAISLADALDFLFDLEGELAQARAAKTPR